METKIYYGPEEYTDEGYRARLKYYSTLLDKDLTDIVNEGLYTDELKFVLRELYKRDKKKALKMTKSLLEHKNEDEFLQAWAADFLMKNNYNMTYVFQFLRENKEAKDVYDSVYKEINE